MSHCASVYTKYIVQRLILKQIFSYQSVVTGHDM